MMSRNILRVLIILPLVLGGIITSAKLGKGLEKEFSLQTLQTVQIYADTADGEEINQYCTNWGECRNASRGTDMFQFTKGSVSSAFAPNSPYGPYSVKRVFQFFDTTSIPTEAQITDATLNFYFEDVQIGNKTIHVVPSTANIPLRLRDFSEVQFVSGGSATSSANSWAAITLNQNAIGWINKDGITKLALIHEYDLNDITPTDINGVTVAMAENQTNRPYLEISYSVPAAEADLSVRKTASDDAVTWGDPLTYRVTVTNHGPGDASNITIVDTLPDQVFFISLIFGQADCPIAPDGSTPGGTIQCVLASLPSGESATMVVDVAPLNGSGTLINSATVSADESDPDTANNTDTVNTTLIPFGTPTPTNTPAATDTPRPTATKTPKPSTATTSPTLTTTPTPANTPTATRTSQATATNTPEPPTATPLPTLATTATPPPWVPENPVCGQVRIVNSAPPCNLCTFNFIFFPSSGGPPAEWFPEGGGLYEDRYYRIQDPQVALWGPWESEVGSIYYRIYNQSSYVEVAPSTCPLPPTPTPTPKPADLIISDINIAPTTPSALENFSIIIKVKNTGDTRYNPGDGNYKVEVRFVTDLGDKDWTIELDSENTENAKRLSPTRLSALGPSGGSDTMDITIAGLILSGGFNGRMEVRLIPKSGDSNLDNNTRSSSLVVNGLLSVSCGALLFDVVIWYLLEPAKKAGYLRKAADEVTEVVLDTTSEIVPCVLNGFNRGCIANALNRLLSLVKSDNIFDVIDAIIRELLDATTVEHALGCTLDCIRAVFDAVGRLSGRGISANAVMVNSPVYVLVSNSRGQRAGFLDDGTPILEIADARIGSQGERKFLLYSGADTTQVRVKGIDTGTFSLLFVISRGDTALEVEYLNVPTTATMVGTIDTTNNQYVMSIDQNGDGNTDTTKAPDNVTIIKSETIYLPAIVK